MVGWVSFHPFDPFQSTFLERLVWRQFFSVVGGVISSGGWSMIDFKFWRFQMESKWRADGVGLEGRCNQRRWKVGWGWNFKELVVKKNSGKKQVRKNQWLVNQWSWFGNLFCMFFNWWPMVWSFDLQGELEIGFYLAVTLPGEGKSYVSTINNFSLGP